MKIIYITAFLLTATPAFALGDGEALQLLVTIDKSEVKLAELALEKASNAKVREYARMLNEQHTKNVEKGKAVADKVDLDMADSLRSTEMQIRGTKNFETLQSMASGRDFELSFMDLMVKGHTEALDLIDSQLTDSVQSDDVKKYVAETRESLQSHLQQAQELQSGL